MVATNHGAPIPRPAPATPAATPPIDPVKLAQRFHEAYERLAPQFGYETRKASAVPWDDVPQNNRLLMVAVCAEILGGLRGEAR